jgi:surfeit locus 1 family protein
VKAGGRVVVFVTLAVALAALFVRLGFWQLDRLGERRSRNADLTARLAQPIVAFEELRDTSSFRRAMVSGEADYANDIVYTGRSRNGSPGVYVLTPVRRVSNDTAVLVIRGWVYAPDAASIDLSAWRERRAFFSGYVSALPPALASESRRENGRKMRVLSTRAVRDLLPYPVAALYLVSQDSTADGTPVRLTMPALDNGPHLSYAIQWFAFAAIALIGAAIILRKARVVDSKNHQ